MSILIHPYCRFKTKEGEVRAQSLCQAAFNLLNDMAAYCSGEGWPFLITDSVSTLEEDQALKRMSDEHATGRAFDISTRGWRDQNIRTFIQAFEKTHGDLAPIGMRSGKPILIVRHIGTADHLHVQVARKFGIKNPLARPDQA
jgi:hypothetical protein